MAEGRPAGTGERRRRGRPQYGMRDSQSFLDILCTVLRYVLIIILIMAIVRYASEAYRLGYEVFSNEAMAETGQGQEVTIEIRDGMSNAEVGTLLEENGLIRDARVFPLQARLASDDKIVPGTYTLSTEMTTDEILKQLTGAASGSGASTETGETGEAAQESTESTEGETAGT